MEEKTVEFKFLGTVNVGVIKEPPFHIRLANAIKQNLGVEYDPEKHAYLRHHETERRLGSSPYDIFEKIG